VTLTSGLEVTQDHSNWYHSPSIVTMALSCISSEIKPDTGRKNFYTPPPLHSMPPLGGPRRNTAIPFGMGKLEWWGYPILKKVWGYV